MVDSSRTPPGIIESINQQQSPVDQPDERFRSLLGRIARVPKAEVEREEKKYQASRRKAKRQATSLARRRSE